MSDLLHSENSPLEPAEPEVAVVLGADEPDRTKRILRQRAEQLSRPLDEEDLEETADLVTLDLDGHHYAIQAELVREVYPVRGVTPLPTSPDFVLGITNVRAKIIAVLDLLRVLGLGATTRTSREVVIVEVGGVEVAFDVGESGIARVPRSRLRPSSLPPQAYVKSITHDDLGILDVERIIAETRQTAASLASGDDA